jgi:hypothetical protein
VPDERVPMDATGRTVRLDDLCQAAKWVVAGEMTRAQARQYLDALAEERQ